MPEEEKPKNQTPPPSKTDGTKIKKFSVPGLAGDRTTDAPPPPPKKDEEKKDSQ